MFKKIFVDVFFEKKIILISFILIFIILLFYTGIQTVLLASQYSKQLISPDVQMSGSARADGVLDFKLYNDMTGLSSSMRTSAKDEMNVYGVTCRNILTAQDEKTLDITFYWIYGVDDLFFDKELKSCLKDGRMPQKGAKEVVIGSYAARFYKVNLNDKINIPVTLNSTYSKEDISQYRVVGILDDNISYFRGATFISKDTYKKLNPNVAFDENVLLIYFKNSNGYKHYEKILSTSKDLFEKYNIKGYQANYLEKNNTKLNLIISYSFIWIVGFIILYLLLSYILKGITKKIGLLKALGISDKYITKVFIGGIGACLMLSLGVAILGIIIVSQTLNYNLSKFYGFKVKIYTVKPFIYFLLIGLSIIIFLIIYLITKVKSSKISPRDAMLKI
jgi:ABC-type lipoprotein release transport system permease subunit